MQKVACFGGIEVTAEEEGSRIVDLLRSSLRGEGQFKHFPPPFVASFTTHSEDTVEDKYHRSHGVLSQWRGYASNSGVALVFDSRKIEELLEREGKRFTHLPWHVVDVIYEEATGFERSTFQTLPKACGSGWMLNYRTL